MNEPLSTGAQGSSTVTSSRISSPADPPEGACFTKKTTKLTTAWKRLTGNRSPAGEKTLQTRLASEFKPGPNTTPSSVLRWLGSDEPVRTPSMILANSTLEKVQSIFRQQQLEITNLISPNELRSKDQYARKMEVCRDTDKAWSRLKGEAKNRTPATSEVDFLKYCQIPSKTGGVQCDLAALLTYRELYKQAEITPFLIRFAHPSMNHYVVGIFHDKSTCMHGRFDFPGSIAELGDNIHIVDSWLGIACQATHYPHFATTTLDHLNSQGHQLLRADQTGTVTASSVPGEFIQTKTLLLHNLSTSWKGVNGMQVYTRLLDNLESILAANNPDASLQ